MQLMIRIRFEKLSAHWTGVDYDKTECKTIQFEDRMCTLKPNEMSHSTQFSH